MRAPFFLAAAAVVVVVVAGGCVDKAAEAKKKADQQRALFDAEAKAQAEADAKEAKAAYDVADKGCAGGDAAKCVDLAKMYADGKGAPKDGAKSLDVYAKACGMKSKDGCRQAAIAQGNGKKRLGFLSSLCDLGDIEGCVEGAKLADGLVQSKELPEPKKPQDRDAMKLLKKACALGGAIACTARGVGLVSDDPAGAVDAFGKGCDAGEPTSCWQLGQLLKQGKGVKKKDEKRAAELMKKACDAGLKDACAG